MLDDQALGEPPQSHRTGERIPITRQIPEEEIEKKRRALKDRAKAFRNKQWEEKRGHMYDSMTDPAPMDVYSFQDEVIDHMDIDTLNEYAAMPDGQFADLAKAVIIDRQTAIEGPIRKRKAKKTPIQEYWYEKKRKARTMDFDEFLEKYGYQIDKAVNKHNAEKWESEVEKRERRRNDAFRQACQSAIKYYTKRANEAKTKEGYEYWCRLIKENLRILRGFDEVMNLEPLAYTGEYKEFFKDREDFLKAGSWKIKEHDEYVKKHGKKPAYKLSW